MCGIGLFGIVHNPSFNPNYTQPKFISRQVSSLSLLISSFIWKVELILPDPPYWAFKHCGLFLPISDSTEKKLQVVFDLAENDNTKVLVVYLE